MFDKSPNSITPHEAYELVGDTAPGFKIGFYEEPHLDDLASRAEGRPITANRLCVRIKIRGDRDETCRLATKADQQRWPAEYERFIRAKELHESHTPIWAMAPMGVATVAALQALGCSSIQELAGAPVFDNPKDYDLEIARCAAVQIADILEAAKHEREQAEENHESNAQIIARANQDFDSQASAEHQAKAEAFQAQENNAGGDGQDVAGFPVPGHGPGVSPGGQIDPGANVLRPRESQRHDFQDYGPRITTFDFEIEGIAANG